jgi:hypothetical protein
MAPTPDIAVSRTDPTFMVVQIPEALLLQQHIGELLSNCRGIQKFTIIAARRQHMRPGQHPRSGAAASPGSVPERAEIT